MTLLVPTEEAEQASLIQWLTMKSYKFTAIPNSTYTKSIKQKMKNKRMGLRAGFPDLIVIANNRFMAIELKRQVGGNNGTPAQREWIGALNNAGIPAAICKGASEAIVFINSITAR